MNTVLIKRALIHALKKAEEQSSSFANQKLQLQPPIEVKPINIQNNDVRQSLWGNVNTQNRNFEFDQPGVKNDNVNAVQATDQPIVKNNDVNATRSVGDLAEALIYHPRPLDLKPPVNTQSPGLPSATANKGFLSRLGSKVKSIFPKSITGPVGKAAPYVMHYGGQALGAVGTGMDAYNAYQGFKDEDPNKRPQAILDSMATAGGAVSLAGFPEVGIPIYGAAKIAPYANKDPQFWKNLLYSYHY